MQQQKTLLFFTLQAHYYKDMKITFGLNVFDCGVCHSPLMVSNFHLEGGSRDEVASLEVYTVKKESCLNEPFYFNTSNRKKCNGPMALQFAFFKTFFKSSEHADKKHFLPRR